MQISTTLQAGFWGWLAASGLLIGAAIGFWARLPRKLVAAVMAYGSGVLIAALCFEQRSGRYVFGVWSGIVLLSGLAAMAGPGLFAGLSPLWLAFALGFSAGAVLCMLVDTLIPEAFAETHALTGLITLSGFMTAFALEHLA